MISAMSVSSRPRATDPTPASGGTAGVEGNARITGSLGAAIFLLLFVEGITILRVGQLITMHVFIGMMLVAFATAKIGSTGYRFVRYYRGDVAYVRKGAPPLVLRAIGPIAVLLTVAVLGTGIAALLTHRQGHWLLLHKASFILWFGAMTIHVLGHALETPALAIADLRSGVRDEAPGVATRLGLLAVTLLLGVVLGLVSLGWVHHWQALRVR
jgi:hypothetical protein